MEGSENQLEHKKEGVYLTYRLGLHVRSRFSTWNQNQSQLLMMKHDSNWCNTNRSFQAQGFQDLSMKFPPCNI